ncbi:MAG: hypothetical protein GY869_08925, partial [Planctomycetes bacterium]|nr:hypothetical protein [Planctomycetota bacterium]
LRGKNRLPDFDPNDGTTRQGAATCLVCNQSVDGAFLQQAGKNDEMGQRLMAVIYEQDNAGKGYRPATETDEALFQETADRLQQTVTEPETGYRLISAEGAAAPIAESIFESRDERLGIIWEDSDPSAIAGNIGVSAALQNSFVIWYLNDERAALYHDTSIPLWEYDTGDVDFNTALDMLEDGSRMALGTNNVLAIFSTFSSNPIWEYALGGDIKGLALSPDGSIVFVSERFRNGGNTSYVTAYDISLQESIWEVAFPGGAEQLVLSGDGTTLISTQYTGGVSAMWVMNAVDGSIIFEGPEYNQNPPAISEDGSIIVNGDYSGYVQVYEYDPDLGTYYELWNYHVGGGGTSAWIGGMGISADGSTIAVGTLVFLADGFDGEIYTFNTYSPQPTWIYEHAGDYVVDIDLSADGSLIAASGYGPSDNSSPDFWLFRKISNVPLFTIDTPGSMFYLDLSADGSLCTVGGKAVHARIMGSGGLLYHLDCELGGGLISGTVDLDGSEDNSGAKVEVIELVDYFDFSEIDGSYSIDNVPPEVYTVRASKVGYEPESITTVVDEGGTTTVDFTLLPVGYPPQNLFATQAAGLTVNLSWTTPENSEPVAYNIYRKTIAGDPYPENPLALVSTGELSFEDDQALPSIQYYYAVTSLYEDDLQSPYSNEANGWISTGFVVDEISVYYGSTPVIDGVISEGEWDDAFMIDCSDFLGTYDNMANPIGSVMAFYKMNPEETELYVAYFNLNDTVLEDHDEVALYIDDNNDDLFPQNGAGDLSEGNYWAVYYATG